jgi:hypothetical protein
MHTVGKIDEKLQGYFMPITIVDNPPEDVPVVFEEREWLARYLCHPNC